MNCRSWFTGGSGSVTLTPFVAIGGFEQLVAVLSAASSMLYLFPSVKYEHRFTSRGQSAIDYVGKAVAYE